MEEHPIIIDKHGVERYKANAIVTHLLDDGPFDMNTIALRDFSREDRQQFAKLIGYSLYGYEELPYSGPETEDCEKCGGSGQTPKAEKDSQ